MVACNLAEKQVTIAWPTTILPTRPDKSEDSKTSFISVWVKPRFMLTRADAASEAERKLCAATMFKSITTCEL